MKGGTKALKKSSDVNWLYFGCSTLPCKSHNHWCSCKETVILISLSLLRGKLSLLRRKQHPGKPDCDSLRRRVFSPRRTRNSRNVLLLHCAGFFFGLFNVPHFFALWLLFTANTRELFLLTRCCSNTKSRHMSSPMIVVVGMWQHFTVYF